MLSMTGFGAGECRRHGKLVKVMASSINRKQADFRISLPRELAFLERDVRDQLKACVQRGAVNVVVELCDEDGVAAKTHVNLELAKSCWANLQALRRELGIAEPPTLRDLLAMPEIFTVGAPPLPEADLRELALTALTAALAGLCATRRGEGAALQADLLERHARLGRILARVNAKAPDVPRYYREKLLQRLKEFGADLPVDDDRLAREVTFFADRADITEEITRLTSHLQQLAELLKADDSMGRKLDFLIQELSREINTLGAKASDKDIAVCVVDFKTELERIREQVQNLE